MSRIYIGNLPTDIRESELDKLFGKFGRIRNITIKVKFAFLEYDDPRDADDAIHEMDRVNFGGYSLQVERARGGRESRDDGPRGGGGGGGGRGQYRVEVSGAFRCF
jgi:arginine/serine-rich splicing factor 1/9